MEPLYLNLSEKELSNKIEEAWDLLSPCRICPRKCGTKRDKDDNTGFCKMGEKPVVAAAHPHFGEEKCLTGKRGSGAIFFSSCNMNCVFCQNFRISQFRYGQEITCEELANKMVVLQGKGCENINLVSPTIWVPQILKALKSAREKGLTLPLVYNTGGYDSVEALNILEGVIDIYLPDIKYGGNENALKYSDAPNYFETAKKAIREMDRQVGPLKLNSEGTAEKGVLVRHLVLPSGLSESRPLIKFIASLSKKPAVNIMDQYRPAFRSLYYDELNRPTTKEEVDEVLKIAKKRGLRIVG